jgi:rhamnogalacturonan endolyase
LSGRLIRDLNRLDSANINNWSIQDDLQVDNTVYGDRVNVFTSIPEQLIGTEWLRVAANARVLQADTAEFVANEDIFVYIGIDARRNSADLPWIADGEWQSTNMTVTATDQTAPDGPGITYNLYRVALTQGESLRLGSNGPAGGVIMYTVFFEPNTGEDESELFIKREFYVGECPDCGEEKQWVITTMGRRQSDGAEFVISRRWAVKRDSDGDLFDPCEGSLRWE